MPHQTPIPPTAPPSTPGSPREHLDYLLTAYVFENLSAAGRAEVERHLSECALCRAQLAELRATVALAEAALDDGGRAYVFDQQRKDRVLKAAAARQWRGWNVLSFNRFSWKIAAVAAMLMVVAVVALAPVFLRFGEEREIEPLIVSVSAQNRAVEGHKDFGDRIASKAEEKLAEEIEKESTVLEKRVEDLKKLPDETPARSESALRGKEQFGTFDKVIVNGDARPKELAAKSRRSDPASPVPESKPVAPTTPTPAELPVTGVVFSSGDQNNDAKGKISGYREAPATPRSSPAPAPIGGKGGPGGGGAADNYTVEMINGVAHKHQIPAEYKDEPYQVLVKPADGNSPAEYETRARRVPVRPQSQTFEAPSAPTSGEGGRKDVAIAAKDDTIRKQNKSSRDMSALEVPPDIQKKAELGDHFETINLDRPDQSKEKLSREELLYRADAAKKGVALNSTGESVQLNYDKDGAGKDGKKNVYRRYIPNEPPPEIAIVDGPMDAKFGPASPVTATPKPRVPGSTDASPPAPAKSAPVDQLAEQSKAAFSSNNLNINNSDELAQKLNDQTEGLSKSGNGTLTLNGVATYSGGTTVFGGTLAVPPPAKTPGAIFDDVNKRLGAVKGEKEVDELQSDVAKLRGLFNAPQGAPAADQDGEVVDQEKAEKALEFNFNGGDLNEKAVLKELDKRKSDMGRVQDFPGPAFDPQAAQQQPHAAGDLFLYSGHGNGVKLPQVTDGKLPSSNLPTLFREIPESLNGLVGPNNKVTLQEVRAAEQGRQAIELNRQLAEQNSQVTQRDAKLSAENIAAQNASAEQIDKLTRDPSKYQWYKDAFGSPKLVQGVDSSFFSNADGVVSLNQKEAADGKPVDSSTLNKAIAENETEAQRRVNERKLNMAIDRAKVAFQADEFELAKKQSETDRFKTRIGKLIEHAEALNDSGDKKSAFQMAQKILMLDPQNVAAAQISSEARRGDYSQLFSDGAIIKYPENWDMISRRQADALAQQQAYNDQLTSRAGDLRANGVYLPQQDGQITFGTNTVVLSPSVNYYIEKQHDDESKLRAFSHFRTSNSRLTLPQYIRHPEPVPPVPLTDEGMDEDAYIEKYGTRPFVDCARDHLSTFGMDVDTAAYTRTRALLREGKLPAADLVRVEEFVNYFKQNYVVEGDEAFGVFAEAADSPFIDPTIEGGAASKPTRQLLRIGIKSREARPNERKPATLTFVVDMSGSMNRRASNNSAITRMELVKQALNTLLEALNPDDAVTIIGFSEQAEMVLPRTQARQRQRILDGIESMQANGSTNVESGLLLGLRIADETFAADSINRMVLISDGMANVGANGPDELLKTVRSFAQRGVDLSTVGVGLGKLNDEMLRKFADAGNGACHFADTVDEAKKILLEKLPPHLNVLARDAKVQVDFDPQIVKSYRLLGYEKRKIADKDFRNDAVNAGEVAHNTLVTALYEIVRQPGAHGSMGKVFLRWKDAGYAHQPVVERNYPLSEGIEMGPASKASPDFRFLACVARFAELLRDSKWTRHGSYGEVLNELNRLPNAFKATENWKEVYELVTKARDLSVSKWKTDLGI